MAHPDRRTISHVSLSLRHGQVTPLSPHVPFTFCSSIHKTPNEYGCELAMLPQRDGQAITLRKLSINGADP